MRSVKKVLEKIMAAEVVIGGLLIILMVGIMVLEVIMRYIFNNSIIWVQEFVIMVFIWITNARFQRCTDDENTCYDHNLQPVHIRKRKGSPSAAYIVCDFRLYLSILLFICLNR